MCGLSPDMTEEPEDVLLTWMEICTWAGIARPADQWLLRLLFRPGLLVLAAAEDESSLSSWSQRED